MVPTKGMRRPLLGYRQTCSAVMGTWLKPHSCLLGARSVPQLLKRTVSTVRETEGPGTAVWECVVSPHVLCAASLGL